MDDTKASRKQPQQEEPKKSTMDLATPVNTPTTVVATEISSPLQQEENRSVAMPSVKASIEKTDPSEAPGIPLAEKSSSTSATMPSLGSPTPATATLSPVADTRGMILVPSATSYASLLMPATPAPSPAAAAAAAAALTHHQLQQTLALAAHHRLPGNIKAAMAMMAHQQTAGHTTVANTAKIYGGPSSAFQKPFILKENMPPYGTVSTTTSTSSPIVSRQTSPTTQSPGEQSSTAGREGPPSPSYEALLEENRRLQEETKRLQQVATENRRLQHVDQVNSRLHKELKQKDEVIVTLQNKASGLEKQICELRQLPTGKISHIPVDEMKRIMEEYGSEVSNQTLPKRNQSVQKASIVRQFRRWNPEFFRFFVHINGQWVPRLGREGELKRRAEKRRSLQKNKRAGSPDSAKSN